jgi:hypothetical protein
MRYVASSETRNPNRAKLSVVGLDNKGRGGKIIDFFVLAATLKGNYLQLLFSSRLC